jgi:protein gp37
MGDTKIEWATKVWNPVVGCTPVSQGCAHCYAKRIFERFHPGEDFSKIQLHPEKLDDPFHWKNSQRIFVNSMSDLFHPDIPFGFIDDVFAVMTGCSRHTFMVLTKRPERMLEWSKQYYLPGANRSSNIWLGVTAENQKAAEERIPFLLQVPAAVRFISVEPMLGPVNLARVRWARIAVDKSNYDLFGAPAPDEIWSCRNVLQSKPGDQYNKPMIGLNWIICGGESGPDARPINPAWVRSLRDQCVAAGVPFFFKQWGEWTPEYPQGISLANRKETYIDGYHYYRVGKAKAGRLLDGDQWDQFPKIAEVASPLRFSQ